MELLSPVTPNKFYTCSADLTACFIWSGREDLNLRHPAPKAGALPGCATPRLTQSILQQLTHLCKGFRPMADPVLLFA